MWAFGEQGSALRSFTPDGTLRWELHGEFFCDVATADPADDAATVWGIQERYAMDWSKSPGRESAVLKLWRSAKRTGKRSYS